MELYGQKNITDLNVARLAKLIENSNDIFMLADCTGQIFYLSPAFERITQYSFDEIKGKSKEVLVNLVHPDFRADSLKLFEKIINNPGVSFRGLIKIKNTKGEYIWIERCVTNWLNDPEINAIVSVYHDVDERQKSNEKALEKEKMFRSLINSNKDMMALCDKDGKLFYISPSITKILGYGLESIPRIGLINLIHPEESEIALKNLLSILQKHGDSFDTVQRIKHKNGTWIWCEGTITNLLEDYSVGALVLNFRDISERKKSEQQREFDRKNLKALINNTPDLIWSVNTHFKLITSNIHFDNIVKEILGDSIKKGKEVLALGFSEEQLSRWKAYYERAFKGECFTVIEYNDYPREMCSEISFTPIYKDENIIGTACYSRDILKRVKAEERLLKQYNALKEIAFMLSHQARAPIASVLGLISLLNFENLADPMNVEVLQNVKKTTTLFDAAIHEIVKSTAEINKLELN